MSKMKNKDDVPIIIDQVWLDYMGNQLTILNAHDYQRRAIGQLYDRKGRLDSYGFNIDDGSLTRLISCPVLGDMSEWRIVTAEEREKYPVPSCAEFLSYDEKWYPTLVANDNGWRADGASGNMLYRVPLDFDFEAEQGPTCDKCHNPLGGNTYAGFDDDGKEVWCAKCYAKSPFHHSNKTCPDCNKAESVCECKPPTAPDTLELLDPYNRRYEPHIVKMIETINALIKRTEGLT
jgi:hypothetical protein